MKIRGAYTITTPVVVDEAGLKAPVRDAIINSFPNEGLRCCFDFGFGWSYPGGELKGRPEPTDPVNGQSVYDLTCLSTAAVYKANLVPSDPIRYSGGGLYFGDCVYPNSNLRTDASITSDIWTPYLGKSQRFAVCAYIKMPTKANWYSASTQAAIVDIGVGAPTASVASMLVISQASGYTLRATRQYNGSGTTITNLTVPDDAFDKVAQISYTRDDSGVTLRLAWDGGEAQVKTTVGTDNAGNFSAGLTKFGFPGTYSAYPLNAFDQSAAEMKAYRIWVANLARAGSVDMATILADDLARVLARGDFT